jgi:autonomous glycyl radical cofactor GrcA
VLGTCGNGVDADDGAGKAVMRRLAVGCAAAALLLRPAGAQTRFTYSTGQSVSPAYEGWTPNEDGSSTMYFGYMNTNWLEEFDIPAGAANAIEPGGPDQGQPTHFYPRRNPFLFTIRVPKDFGNKELTWTLAANGKTEHAYASLKTDYQIDNQVISTEVGGDFGSLRDELRTNVPPELKVEGEKHRSVKVGEVLTLIALAGDPDNLPARRDGKPQPRNASGQHSGSAAASADSSEAAPRAAPVTPASSSGASSPANLANLLYRPPSSIVPSSGPGLRLSWIVYRGKAGAVTFTPDQMKTWTDTRAYANSPWSPPFAIPLPPADGTWTAQASFAESGTYVLRAVASDGAIFTYENVTVTVTR